MPESDDPLPSLDELQRKIDRITPEGDKEPSVNAANQGRALHLATELLAGVGVGGFMGFFLDRALGTMPWFFILFFFLGFAAGVRNLLRRYQKVEE